MPVPLNRCQEMDPKGNRQKMPIEMEVQDVLGSLKPIPFAQVVQSMDFVEQPPFGQTEGIPPKKRKKSVTVKREDPVFIDGGDASNFVETILDVDPPSKIPRRQSVGGGRAQQVEFFILVENGQSRFRLRFG